VYCKVNVEHSCTRFGVECKPRPIHTVLNISGVLVSQWFAGHFFQTFLLAEDIEQ